MSIIETRYSVTGMKCGGCIAKATAAVSKIPGYGSVDFDLKTGSAVVKGSADPQAVANALTKVGYPAVASKA